MSYCRFSNDDFRCDVYAYESCHGGFVVHVAGNKVRGWIPRIWIPPRAWILQAKDPSRFKRMRYWVASRLSWLTYRIQMRYLDLAPRRALGLAFDGKSFDDSDAAACADRLEWLRLQGYRVPQFAIDNLRDEDREARAAIALAGVGGG